MLTILAFEKWNFGDNVEIDIVGKNYKKLIEECFKFAKYFSFIVEEEGDNIVLEIFSPFFVRRINNKISHGGNINGLFIRHISEYVYLCCPETKAILQDDRYSLFYWNGSGKGGVTPEDLAFYREDATVFLETVAHDMNCYAYLQESEIKDFIGLAEWEILQNRPYRDEHYLPQF